MLTFLGENLLQGASPSGTATHIATLFPHSGTIVTLPGIHATQREAYLDHVDRERCDHGMPPLSTPQRDALREESVDLILKGDKVLIRPDPCRMDLAFEADALLQDLVSKRRIRFLFASDPQVRNAISRRGEAWRIYPLPKSPDEIRGLIASARTSVAGEAIYYYSVLHGSRLLTAGQFANLDHMPDAALRQHLCEIADLARRYNVRGYPELDLFLAQGKVNPADFAQIDWAALPPADLRPRYRELSARYQFAVPAGFQFDDPDDIAWRNRMYAALVGHADDELSESDLLGLSAEFFMQIEWLPGARIDHGELIFDSVSDEAAPGSANGDMAHGLICNLMQENNDLEFINIGCVLKSLSQRAATTGRREVYVAHFRPRAADRDTLLIIRMQKWGVREHLDEGKDLLSAMIESNEYTDYIMDRRLGCRQLGMNLPPRVSVRKVTEAYDGRQKLLAGTTIWSPYFQRDYVAGVASDKIPSSKLRDPRYAAALATLLGQAAAPNLIVGRCDNEGRVIFDDGDEMITEDAAGLPAAILVADHTGTFGDYRNPLTQSAPAYADAVNRRAAVLPSVADFAEAYLDGFLTRFREIQNDYLARQRAFDALFRHRRCDPAGNLAYRWKLILNRLADARPEELANAIRCHLTR